MKNLIWQIGDVRITSIVETDAGSVIQEGLEMATKEELDKVTWLRPHFVDDEGNLIAVVQSFFIEVGDKKILIDTCVGNDKNRVDIPVWSNLQTDFLEKLGQVCKREDVQIVFCTHFHFDHVGWNTMLVEGEWIPTFPNAEYFFSEKEYEYWKHGPANELNDDANGYNDSVKPVIDAGLAKFISHDHKLADEISLIPTPGHTPDHMSVLIESKGECAIITGDAFHHPIQIVHTEWEPEFDTSVKDATQSRIKLLDESVEKNALFIGSHFAAPSAGKISKENAGYKLTV